MKVLCVAEKPSIARSITGILSGGQYETRATSDRYTKNYDFQYNQLRANFTVTAVRGHLMSHDFTDLHRKWYSCDPVELFDAPIVSSVTSDLKNVERNLVQEARSAQRLMIWTDCDREGENIGAEIVEVCRRGNPNIVVQRARFSAIIAQQIHNAAQHPVALDYNQVHAVEARTLLDLRFGAAFTRLQTLRLQARFPELELKVVSYGPCQFPTLGFVVSRYEQVKSFHPEQFWYIFLSVSRREKGHNTECEFKWRRGHLFEFPIALVIYEMVLENPMARVQEVKRKPTKKWKPLPLTTVELQKSGSRLLRLAPKKILDLAEGLYQKGFLSYPRTETDIFDNQFDFNTLIDKQRQDDRWGTFATQLLDNGGFGRPRRGRKDDKAHPPIHPTAAALNLSGDEKRVYEFVTRRFLACCSKDAEGWETTVEVLCGGEEFFATGLTVIARNYLEVYPYDKWGDKHLPEFEDGEQFMPSVCELRDGQTSSPSLLTEADLVSLMDKNGIGTDATIAQHIQTIVDREYVMERMEGNVKYLLPSTLGIALVEGYNKIGFDKSLSKPQLRRDTEREMVRICEGLKDQATMMNESVELYKTVFLRAKEQFEQIVQCVQQRVQGAVGGVPVQRSARRGHAGRGDGGAEGGGGPGGGGAGGGDGRGNGGGGGAAGGGRGNAGGSGRAVAPGGNGAAPRPPPPRPPPPPQNDFFEESYDDDPDIIQPVRRPQPPSPAPAPRPIASSSRVAPTASMRELSQNNNSSQRPNCNCNVPAAERTAGKDNENKGRQFWTCGNERTCDFFQWADSVSDSAPRRDVQSVVPAKRPSSQQMNRGSAKMARMCGCDLTAVSRTVNKDGPTKGRRFWSCPNSEGARCGFFEWEDADGSGGSGASAGAGGGGGRTGTCYKCDEEGHWASNCPNQGQGAPSSRGAPPGRQTDGECYKCHQPGHWSTNCPNGDAGGSGGGRGSSQSARGGGGGSSEGSCYKCGESGHWSKDCTGEGNSSFGGGGRGGSSSGRSSRGSSKRGRGSTRRTSGAKRGSKRASKFAAADDSF